MCELPTGWRVFHDVDLGGENADHVVVGPGGVYAIEVKNYSAAVKATPNGLFTNGHRNDKVERQACRVAHRLRDLLGLEVEPLLVFLGALEGDRAGRLPVLSAEQVIPHLLASMHRLDHKSAKEAWLLLEARVQ